MLLVALLLAAPILLPRPPPLWARCLRLFAMVSPHAGGVPDSARLISPPNRRISP
jgi:hypothetical protein